MVINNVDILKQKWNYDKSGHQHTRDDFFPLVEEFPPPTEITRCLSGSAQQVMIDLLFTSAVILVESSKIIKILDQS